MSSRTLFNTIETLRRAVQGDVILPGDESYGPARQVWNAMIDRRPAVIVRCATAGDVPHALGFARDHHLEVAIRGAGHNIAGSGVCDDGLVIDMSRMKTVAVDPASRRAYVQAGATLADVDTATQAHGLATPLGINSTTGLAGLTLGGGFGWLTRQYVLRRRSQGNHLTWSRMGRYVARWLPTPRICHPYPRVRFAVTTRGKSRMR